MTNKSIEKEKITVDYTVEGVPESVRNFRPEVYYDGYTYCSMLGIDAEQGVFGYGDTLEEALTDWDLAYQKRKQPPVNEKDTVGQFLRDKEDGQADNEA